MFCSILNHDLSDLTINFWSSVMGQARLRTVPIFSLELVEPQKDIANAGTQKL